MTRDDFLKLLLNAYRGPGSTEEGTFAGDVLRPGGAAGRRFLGPAPGRDTVSLVNKKGQLTKIYIEVYTFAGR